MTLRGRVLPAIAIVWAVFTAALAIWWLVFGLAQAQFLGDVVGPRGMRLQQVQRMLLWEGAVLIALVVVGGVALVIAARREQARQRSVEAFFMAFTHELKTALASLQLQAESLVEDLPDAAGNRSLQRLMTDALRLQLQLENSLFFAQPDGRLLIEPLDVADQVTRVSSDWPNLRVRVRGTARVLADARALQSVLRNVLQNAVVHGEATEVVVDVVSSGRRVSATLADNGRGASPAVIEALGEPFARRVTSTGGTGVGLFVSRQLVLRMKGTLAWRSAASGGFAVIVDLPGAA